MKITSISATNFKGRTFSDYLGGVNLIYGDNYSGKSARADAIRVALLGYLPELGKRNQDTFKLSSGKTMSVSATFDDGSTVTRIFSAKGNSISQTVEPANWTPRPDWAVMVDTVQYLGMTEKQRTEYIFGLVKLGDDYSIEKVRESALAACENAKRGIENLDEKAFEIVRERVEFAFDDNDRSSPQVFVGEALNTFAERVKEAKDAVARMEKTNQGITALKLSEGSAKVVSVEAHGQRLLDLDVKIGELTELMAAEKAKINADYAAREAALQYQDDVKTLEGLRLLAPDDRANRATLAEKEATLAKLQKERDDLMVEIMGRVEENDRVQARAVNEAVAFEDAVEDVDRIKGDLALIELQNECPCCGAHGEGWQDSIRDKLSMELKAALKKRNDLEVISAKVKAESEARRTETEAKWQAWRDMGVNKVDAAIKEVAYWKERVRDDDAFMRDFREIEKRTAQAPTFATKDVVEKWESDLQALAQSKAKLEEERSAIRMERDQAIARHHDQKRAAEAQLAADVARISLEIFKAVKAELEEWQSEMVDKAFEPIIKKANLLGEPVLEWRLAYRGGEFGFVTDKGVFWAHDTFSGTERAVAYAALSMAIASESSLKLVIIDELGRLKLEKKRQLMVAAAAAVQAGHLTQFVAIDLEVESALGVAANLLRVSE